MNRTRCLLAAVGCGLMLGACASRPSSEDLAEAILNATQANAAVSVSPEQATCIADQLLASGLSDTTLSGLVANFDSPEVLESEAAEVTPAVAAAAAACQ